MDREIESVYGGEVVVFFYESFRLEENRHPVIVTPSLPKTNLKGRVRFDLSAVLGLNGIKEGETTLAQLRIRRRYRELRLLEQQFVHEENAERKVVLRREFDRIDDGVNKMKVRASYADQFYGLRGHIDYVRRIVEKGQSRGA